MHLANDSPSFTPVHSQIRAIGPRNLHLWKGRGLDPSPNTITIDVTPVSDAPSGSNNTVSVLEDGTKAFNSSDFGFSDPTDTGSDLDTLAAVRIASLPLNGTLKFNGSAITQAQIDAGFDVTSVDLAAGKLTFSPALNAYGSSYSSFSFQVIDTGSTANAGVIIDPSPNTITIDVSQENDAPTSLSGTVALPMVLEDTFNPIGETVGNLFGSVFSDIDPGDMLSGIAVTTYKAEPTKGNWQYSKDNGNSWNDLDIAGSLSSTSALLLQVTDKLRFLPSQDWASTTACPALGVKLIDSSTNPDWTVRGNTSSAGGSSAFSGSTVTLTTGVIPVNDAPVLDLNGPGAGRDYAASFGAGQGTSSVPIAAASNIITDIDDTNIESVTVILTNPQLGDQLQIGSMPTGISLAPGSNASTILLTGSASKEAYQQALRNIVFINNSEIPDTTTRTINISINDGDAPSNTQACSIEVIRVTSLTIPNSRVVEGGNLVFTANLSSAATNSPIKIPMAVANSSTATSDSDYTSTPTFSSGVTYDSTTGLITVPTGVSSFTITYKTLDDITVEGTETVNVRIGGVSATGQITDGAGSSLSITNITVNEKSPTAVFRVSGVEGQEVQLSLQAFNTTAEIQAQLKDKDSDAKPAELTGATVPAQDAGPDLGSQLQYFNGTGWINYSPGSYVKYPTGSTELLVRVSVNDDNPYEGSEAFKLIAQGRAIDSLESQDIGTISAIGVGIIGDFATGAIYNEAGAEDYNAIKDDDRSIKVSSININEGSDYGVFTVTNGESTAISINLSLTDNDQRDNKTGEGAFDFGQTLQIWNGAAWVNYVGNETIQANGRLFVRVNVQAEQDNAFEGVVDRQTSIGEKFRLRASNGIDFTQDSYGTAQILDDGTGVKYTGNIINNIAETNSINLDDDLDKDGISPNTEEILASLSASAGGGGLSGDLNADGRPDAEQSSVATLAWIKKDNFDKAQGGNLTDIKPIISLSVETDTDPITKSNASTAESNYQLSSISVIDQSDARFSGSLPTQTNKAGETISAPWDALVFNIEKRSNVLVDVDPTRAGVQIVVTVDISRSGVKEGEFNRYHKYVSAASAATLSASGAKANDGTAITSAGWYDFTRQKDSNGDYFGDGAQYIVETINGERRITKIQIVFTDNAFGDNRLNAEGIDDPGLPTLVTNTSNDISTESIARSSQQTTANDSLVESNVESNAETIETTRPGTGQFKLEDVGTRSTPINSDQPEDPYIRGSGGPDNKLIEDYKLEGKEQIGFWWANYGGGGGGSGGEGGGEGGGGGGPVTENAPEPSNKPMAFVSEAMGMQQGLGGNLLEALVLGGGTLYALNRLSGASLSRWARQLLPKAPGQLVGGGVYERVVVVFLAESEIGLKRLVAANVNDDTIEILAEQKLPMSLSAAAAPDRADLEQELQQLVDKVINQLDIKRDLLLYDPKIEDDLPIYSKLGRENDRLKPQSLVVVLKSLSPSEVDELRRWINKPSSTDLSNHPLSKRLGERQGQLKKRLNEQKAQLVSLLELSLAMSLGIT